MIAGLRRRVVLSNLSPRPRLTRSAYNGNIRYQPRLASSRNSGGRASNPLPNHFGPPSRSFSLPQISAAIAIFMIGGLFTYSAVNQKENAIGRERLMIFDEEAVIKQEAASQLYEHFQNIARIGKILPDICLPQDDPLAVVARNVFDRMLLAYKLDPFKWQLVIEIAPDSAVGYAMAFHSGIMVISLSLLKTLKYEEELAAFFSEDLARITGENLGELMSFNQFRKICAIPAIQLAITSCFMKKLWLVTIPYLIWYAKYWELDTMIQVSNQDEPELDKASEDAAQQMINDTHRDRGQILDTEDAYRGMLHLARAGIHPRWAVSAWHRHTLKSVQILAAQPTGAEPPNFHEIIAYAQQSSIATEFEMKAARAALLLSKVEKETPNFQAWGISKPTPLPATADTSISMEAEIEKRADQMHHAVFISKQ